MQVASSQRTRRFVGHLERGQELCGAIKAFCEEHSIRAGELRAFGVVSNVEFALYDRDARGYAAPRRLRAFFELVNLQGTIALREGETSLHAYAIVSKDNHDRGGGIDLCGGLLLSAEVQSCEFILEAYDDIGLERSFDPALGIYRLSKAEPRSQTRSDAPPRQAPIPRHAVERPTPHAPQTPTATAAPAASPSVPVSEPEVARKSKATPRIPEGKSVRPSGANSGPTWEDAIARSSQLGDDSASRLNLGDILEHPKFGRCEVQRIDEEAERVSVRLQSGRLVELGLAVLRLEPIRTEGNRQFFRVRTARR